jgi:hypothetical protein
MTTKNLTVGSRVAADAVRDPRSFLNSLNPKRTWNYGVPSPFRGTKKLGKKFRLAAGMPGQQPDRMAARI